MIPEKIQKNPINLPYLPIYSHFTFCHSYFSQFVARFICFLQQVLNGFAATFGKCAGQLQGQSLGEPRGTISSLIIPRKFHSAQQPKKLRIIHGQGHCLQRPSKSTFQIRFGGPTAQGVPERTIWLQEPAEPVQALAQSLEVHTLNDRFKSGSQKHVSCVWM